MAEIVLKSTSSADAPTVRISVEDIGSATISTVTGTPPVGSGLTFQNITPDNTTTPKSFVVTVS